LIGLTAAGSEDRACRGFLAKGWPRRRAKSRIELIADALVDANNMRATLRKIDLRKAPAELREALKEARASADAQAARLEHAILELDDMPITGPRA
jgi:hypothetical protein